MTTSESRVLVTGQTDATQNGLWDTSSASWTRCKDANGNYDLVRGTQVVVAGGSAANQIWILTTANPITIGTSSLTWSQNLSAGFLATLAASGGSALMGFLQAGSNALARTVQGKLRETPVSIADYTGADITGATSSSAALTSAFARSSSVYIPPGNWKFSTGITAPADACLIGSDRETTVLTYSGVNLTAIGNHWIYKLDGGLSDTEYIHKIGAGGRVLINDSSEGRSDVTYTPAATYTIAGALITSYSGGPNGPMGVDPVSGVPLEAALTARVQLTYSATIATNAALGKSFFIVATNGTAFTISSPTNGYAGQRITYRIQNGSGGALGALTWGAAFKLSAWTQPANGFSRAIDFEYDGASSWKQCGGASVDVPN